MRGISELYRQLISQEPLENKSLTVLRITRPQNICATRCVQSYLKIYSIYRDVAVSVNLGVGAAFSCKVLLQNSPS